MRGVIVWAISLPFIIAQTTTTTTATKTTTTSVKSQYAGQIFKTPFMNNETFNDYTNQGQDWTGTCKTGKRQSPIDIPVSEEEGFSRNLDELVVDHEIEFHMELGPALLSNITKTGSGLVFNAQSGAGSLAFILSEETESIFLAEFLGFYIHAPSEHTFNGVHRDMELQLVYQDYQTFEYFIVSIFFDEKTGGSKYNSFIDSLNLDMPGKI